MAQKRVRRVAVSEQAYQDIATVSKGTDRTKTAVVGRLLDKQIAEQASKIRKEATSK